MHHRPVWITSDCDGRRVVLRAERRKHILDDHDELADGLDRILAGLPSPSFRRRGRWPDEEWFYLEGFGPTRYVKVVVHYEQGEGRIVTVFPSRAFP